MKKNVLYFRIIAVLVYAVLFEFFLPVNKILPKPSSIINSLTEIFITYDVSTAILNTFSLYITGIIIVFLILSLFSLPIIANHKSIKIIFNTISLFTIIPYFLAIVLWAFWFPGSETLKVLFIILIHSLLFLEDLSSKKYVLPEFITTLQENFNLKGYKKYSIAFNYLQVSVVYNFIERIKFVWLLLLTFEFIDNTSGCGSIYRQMLDYSDLSGIVTFSLIIGAGIYLIVVFLKYYYSRVSGSFGVEVNNEI